MKTKDIIKKLKKLDPSGEMEILIWDTTDYFEFRKLDKDDIDTEELLNDDDKFKKVIIIRYKK